MNLFQVKDGISVTVDMTNSQLRNTSVSPLSKPYFTLQSVGQLYTLDSITLDPSVVKQSMKSLSYSFRVMYDGSDDVSAADYFADNFAFCLIGNPRTNQAVYFGTNPLMFSTQWKAGVATSYVSSHYICQGSAPFSVEPSDVLEVITRQMTVVKPLGKLQLNLNYESVPAWSNVVCGPGSFLS